MSKIDIKKQYGEFYSPSSKNITVVDIPEFQFLTISGEGGPDSKEAKEAIQTLFPIAYKIKFQLKSEGMDYGVMPLEGLWWANDMDAFIRNERQSWKWTYMIMQPDFVKKSHFDNAISSLQEKNLKNLNNVELNTFLEGKSVQLMHIGPFSDEGPNIQRLHNQISEYGGKLTGKHHEIYLSDFRRVDPVRMKTVIRQPFVL